MSLSQSQLGIARACDGLMRGVPEAQACAFVRDFDGQWATG